MGITLPSIFFASPEFPLVSLCKMAQLLLVVVLAMVPAPWPEPSELGVRRSAPSLWALAHGRPRRRVQYAALFLAPGPWAPEEVSASAVDAPTVPRPCVEAMMISKWSQSRSLWLAAVHGSGSERWCVAGGSPLVSNSFGRRVALVSERDPRLPRRPLS
jgi:hypothetical protein